MHAHISHIDYAFIITRPLKIYKQTYGLTLGGALVLVPFAQVAVIQITFDIFYLQIRLTSHNEAARTLV